MRTFLRELPEPEGALRSMERTDILAFELILAMASVLRGRGSFDNEGVVAVYKAIDMVVAALVV